MAASAAVFSQDQARPVQCPHQDPRGLHAAALGGFHLHRAPLLPHRGSGQGGHQRHGEHGCQQGGPGLAWGAQWLGLGGRVQRHVRLPPSAGLIQSRTSRPLSAPPGLRVICRRMPSGRVLLPSVPGTVPTLDNALDQAPPR